MPHALIASVYEAVVPENSGEAAGFVPGKLMARQAVTPTPANSDVFPKSLGVLGEISSDRDGPEALRSAQRWRLARGYVRALATRRANSYRPGSGQPPRSVDGVRADVALI